ncbi:MAG: M13 family metallopeptidase [Methylococcaceae bacterium]|nr:M13 family metallopeptidase [Methylococcaceae bacterium]
MLPIDSLAFFKRSLTLTAAILFAFPVNISWAASSDDIASEVLSTLDEKADPCNDFYRYACGGWTNSYTLPADEADATKGFTAARSDIQGKLLILLQDANTHPQGNPDRLQMGNYFASCMDQTGAEQEGINALKPYLQAIDKITDADGFLRMAGQLNTLGAAKLFSFSVAPDGFFGSNRNTLYLDASEEGLSDGDIFLKNDKFSKELRKFRQNHVKTVLVQLGEAPVDAQRHAISILQIETTLARYGSTWGKSTGLARVHNPVYLSRIDSSMNWNAFFTGLGSNSIQDVIIDPGFLRELGKTLKRQSVANLKAYLRWGLINVFQSHLPENFRSPGGSRNYFGLQDKPRWKTCVDDTSAQLGEMVGKALVESEQTDRIIPLATNLVSQVESGFSGLVDETGWLDEPSRTNAKAKVSAITAQLGYPKNWADYSSLTLSSGHYLENVILAKQFAFRHLLERYGAPIDRNAWEPLEEPQVVNAYYYVLKNQFTILAGIMRQPFLSLDYPLAMNYGGLGSVIAHETIHGFDSNGRHFLANGNYGQLLSTTSNKLYDERAQCLVKQYSSYPSVNGKKINGKTTLRENTADSDGLRLAYRAFEMAAKSQSGQSLPVGSLTPEQLFFVSFAQHFCSVGQAKWQQYLYSRSWYRYPPYSYRVNGPVSNSPEFAQAFQCRAGTKMNPAKKCQIW